MNSMNPHLPAGRPRDMRAALSTRLRVGSGLVALGEFALLTSAVWLSPFAFSPYAIQNDVYMANMFLAPPTALVGVVAAGVGVIFVLRAPERRRIGLVWVRALLIAAVGAGALALVYELFGGQYHSVGPEPINWPPYLNEVMLSLTPLVGLLVLLAGWWWGPRASHLP
ncbi:MAG TPA: hypothetical protein VE338_09625 [Ktedonobacterales bacterium]|nr:hypothetical protein [Ktedonobacterales bacterium]